MSKFRTPLIFGFFLIISLFANKTFANKIDLTIRFNDPIIAKNLTVAVDDGHGYRFINFKVKDNTISIKEDIYATYGTIELNYKEKGIHFRKYFWIEKQKKSSITFLKSSKPLGLFILRNALDMNVENDDLEKFIEKEWSDFTNFLTENNERMGNNDSIRKVVFTKARALNAKKLEFVKQHKGSFFSLWIFQRYITEDYSKDELLNIYNSTFPEKFNELFESQEALRKINGYGLKAGEKCPSFSSKDINGKEVSLERVRKKYIILNFWASWCKPCIEEMPVLVEISKKYPKESLEIISFSSDSDYRSFEKSVQKLRMGWTNVFNNISINNTFGVHSIPKNILVDPDGKIVLIIDSNNIKEIEVYLEKNVHF